MENSVTDVVTGAVTEAATDFVTEAVNLVDDTMGGAVQYVEQQFQEFSSIRVGPFYLDDLLEALVLFFICMVVIRIVDMFLRRTLRRRKMNATGQGFVEGAVKVSLWILSSILIAEVLGIPTTSLVAVVSVIGLAMSLSIQNILSNLFSGVTLLITKPFERNDYVDIAGKAGTVRSVGLFYTVLTTLDHQRVSIPNGDVTSAAVINYSAEGIRRVDITVAASYDTPTETVRAAMLEAAAGDDRILADPAPMVAIQEFASSSIKYIVRIWCHPTDYWDVLFGMNERVRKCFQEHGAHMTYDHINVHML